jgi:hypothetical protein
MKRAAHGIERALRGLYFFFSTQRVGDSAHAGL